MDDPFASLIDGVVGTGLQNHDQEFNEFLGSGVHWGTIEESKGDIGGAWWTACSWGADVDDGILFASKPQNVSAGYTITSSSGVSGDTVTARSTVKETGKSTTLIEWSSEGDYMGSNAYIGVAAKGVTDNTCNKLPASNFIGFKQINVEDK